MIPAKSTLRRCVGDTEHFATEIWGRRTLVHRGIDDFRDVLSLDDVDSIVSSSVRRPEIRLVRDGSTLDPRSYCGSLRLGGRVLDDVADTTAVARQLHDGASVVLQSLHRTRPSVAAFALALEAEISHPVQANAYLTPAGGQGLAPHSDSHDVIVIQLHGSKRWEIEHTGTVALSAGDTLYLPAGTEHSAASGDEASLHLTVGILRVTHAAVLRRLLAEEEALDRPLPLGYASTDRTNDGLEEDLRRALRSFTDHLGTVDPVEIADRERRRRRPRTRPHGHLSSVVRLDQLDAKTCVQLRPGSPPPVDTGADGAIVVDLGDRTVRLPTAAGPAVERLRTALPVAVDDLPGLDAASQLVVARRLVLEGMLVIRDLAA